MYILLFDLFFLCSVVYEVNGHQTTFNTGWSTAQNSEGDRVLSLEAALVIAHGKLYFPEFFPLRKISFYLSCSVHVNMVEEKIIKPIYNEFS